VVEISSNNIHLVIIMLLTSPLSQSDFDTFFVLTIIYFITLCVLDGYFAVRILEQRRKAKGVKFGFVHSIVVLFLLLILSRLVYIYFDFSLTRFDPATYYLEPNVWFWKIGGLLSNIGYAVLLFVTDYRVFKFKFRGFFAFLLVGTSLVQLFYPVTDSPSFEVASNIDLVANVVAIVLPVFFFYIGRKKSPVRLPSLAVAFGVIIYAIGSNIQNEGFLAVVIPAFGLGARIPIYFMSLILLIGGILMFSYGLTRFANVFSSTNQQPKEGTEKLNETS
jgi:hypothetical protein